MAGHGHGNGHVHKGDIGEDYDIATIVWVGLIGILTIVVTIAWLHATYLRAERWEWERKVVTAPFSELVTLREQQGARLADYDWTDPAKNKVSVPIAEIQDDVLFRLTQAQRNAPAEAQALTEAAAATGPATVEHATEGEGTAAIESELAAEQPAAEEHPTEQGGH